MSALLVACGEAPILADAAHDYYATGQFAGWGGATEALDEDGVTKTYIMEAVSAKDERIDAIADDLDNPTMIYVKEIVLSAEDAGWEASFAFTEGAELTTFNGNLAVKVIQTATDDIVPIYWAQGPESGFVLNLTPDTFFLPPYFEEAPWTDSGDWASNPFAKEAGTYTLVFGSMNYEDEPTLFMALIAVEA